jgi:abortive infection bacteriophage resistance protein
MATYDRPWKSFEDQIDLLKSRGMLIDDHDGALHYLKNLGYYRLSAYWYPFRSFRIEKDPATNALKYILHDDFFPNTDFKDAVALYLFDKKLRLLLHDALEYIEVAIRVDIAHLLGKRNTFAQHSIGELDNGLANKIIHNLGKTKYENWHNKYGSLLARSKEDFVKHYRQKHGDEVPIWVAIEVWDFGAMSQLYAMMKYHDKHVIALKYGVTDGKVFESWLRSLNYLRNLVAHHSRVWNRNVIDQPKLPKLGQIDWCQYFIGRADLVARPFLLLAITAHIIKAIDPASSWPKALQDHLDSFPQQLSDKKLNISDMGVVEGWKIS